VDEVDKEKRWWEEHIDEESELRKPHRSIYEYSRWKRTFELITDHYDFSEKILFVGGCGTGIFEEELNKVSNPKEIIGLDLSDKMIKLARIRNKNCDNLRFIQGNLEETKLPSDYFDVAVVIDALHHVPDPKKALYEIKRISKDLILSEPNALNPIRRINELKFKNQDVKESSFIKWRINKILRELGYNEIKCYNYNFIPSFIPEKYINYF